MLFFNTLFKECLSEWECRFKLLAYLSGSAAKLRWSQVSISEGLSYQTLLLPLPFILFPSIYKLVTKIVKRE